MTILPYSLPPRRRRPRTGWLGLLLVPLLAGAPGEAAVGLASTPPARHNPISPRVTAPPVPAACPARGLCTGEVRITATAAVLIDARSGRILYSRNPHRVWPPASTTKIMTALVALEAGPLTAPVLISPMAAHFREGSTVGLNQGTRVPLHDLLYGLMLPSGNDVALAVAEGVSGTVAAFVARMNDEARRLGATQTHFTSPHGLYNPDHYTTAYDLALISRVAMQNPTFQEIVRTRRWTLHLPGGQTRQLWNHNRFLSRYAGADGVKTGYVHQSGQTLVASATRDGWRLIAVLLHSRDEWGDAERLLSYGFVHFRSAELAQAGEELAAFEVPGADRMVLGVVRDDVYGVLAPGEQPVRRVHVRQDLSLPIQAGERVGGVDFYASGRLIGSAPLVAARGVSAQSEFDRMVEWVGRMVTPFSSGIAL